MKNYVGYSLTRFMFDNAKSYDHLIVRTKIRGRWNILAHGTIAGLNVRLGMNLMNSQIIGCRQDETDNTWFINIDMDKEGKFEYHD